MAVKGFRRTNYISINGLLLCWLVSSVASTFLGESEILYNLVVPSYLKQFSKKFYNESDNWQGVPVPGVTELFKGIENGDCKAHILELLKRSADWRELVGADSKWALQMLDSWGKIPEGILRGHVNSFGDFDECIQVQARGVQIKNDLLPGPTSQDFEGLYCTVYAAGYSDAMSRTRVPVPSTSGLEPNVSLNRNFLLTGLKGEHLFEYSSFGVRIAASIGLCLPNSCSKDDTQQLLVNAMHIFYSFGSDLNPEGDLNGGVVDRPWPFTLACYEDKREDFGLGALIFFGLLSLIMGTCIVTGLLDWGLATQSKAETSQQEGGSTFYDYVMAFSLYKSCKQWIRTKRNAGEFRSLSGIRFISISWIILGHSMFVFTYSPQHGMLDTLKRLTDWAAITAESASFSVDSFFVMAGMLLSYNLLGALEKFNGRIHIGLLYLKRYSRLTPTYAIIIGLTTTLVPHLGNGPYWAVIDRWSEACQANWWTNLLYINNFVNTDLLCQGETWYLANDMQFFILSPLIIYPLWNKERVGVALLTIWTMISCAIPMLLVHFLDLPPTLVPTRFHPHEFFTKVYIKPYARISTYLVGIWLGWIFFKLKGRNIKLSPWIVSTLWILCFGTMLAVPFAIYPWYDKNNEIRKVDALAYTGLSKFAWGVSVAWIIFACEKGYGGAVNNFLSWKLFVPLGRLGFCVYLASLHLQMILQLRNKQAVTVDLYLIINLFFAHMVMSFGVGLVLWLFFESPFLNMQKLFFSGGPNKNSSPAKHEKTPKVVLMKMISSRHVL